MVREIGQFSLNGGGGGGGGSSQYTVFQVILSIFWEIIYFSWIWDVVDYSTDIQNHRETYKNGLLTHVFNPCKYRE